MTKLSHRVFALLVKALAWSVVLFILAQYYSCNNSGITPPDGSDTTSHNFSWRVDALGEGNSSVLNDVAIINDTLAYAVGEIYLQNDPTPYCLAKWDGKQWGLRRLYYYNQQSGATNPLYSVKGIFAFSSTDIWLAPGSVFHWNGTDSLTDFSFNRLTLSDPNATVYKLWGTSSSNLYGVGNAGTVIFFNGSGWQKLSSGTTVDIQDIWGASFDVRGIHLQTILAVASLQNHGRALDLLQINGTSVTKLDTAGLHVNESGVWFNEQRVYVVGNGVFSKSSLAEPTWNADKTQPLIYKRSIRGNGWNDVFIVGDFGLVSHFNGSGWKTYGELTMPTGLLLRVAVRGNLIIAVGFVDNKAVAILGRR